MMWMFRWGYIVPRLVLLGLLLLFSEQGVSVLLKYGAQQAGQAATGARVEIGAAQASLLSMRASLSQIALADPRDPMRNLLEAELLTLDLDSASALRKKAVVKEGELKGIRFGTPRETSGELPQLEAEEASGSFSLPGLVGADATKHWLGSVQDRFTADIQLESVRLAKELRVKWPAEYAQLEARSKQLQQEIKQLTAQVKEARDNPLRNVEFLQSVPNRIATLKGELGSIKERLETLPAQVKADRQAVLAAREHDEKMLREKLAFKDMDADSLSAYLLGDQVAGPVSELFAWLRWARKLAPSGGEKTKPFGRGVDVRFAGCRQTPDLLINSLKLSGAARLAGRPIEFTGQLSDLTTQPTVHGAPMRLSLTTTGAAPIEVRATIDRTGQMATDELIADCPTFSLPKLDLGKPDVLGLSVAPSTASLSVSLMLTGERLSGDVQIVQRDVRVTPHVKASLGDVLAESDLERALGKQLSQTPQLVTTVNLSGDLDQPKWRVWSTAGPAVAEAMDNAVRSLAADRAGRLLAEGQEAVGEHLAALDREVDQMNSLVTSALGEPTKSLQSLASGAAGKGIGNIGSRLAPVGSLFK